MVELGPTTLDNLWKAIGIASGVATAIWIVARPWADQQLLKAYKRNPEQFDKLVLNSVKRNPDEYRGLILTLFSKERADSEKTRDLAEKTSSDVTAALDSLKKGQDETHDMIHQVQRDNSKQTTDIGALGRELSEMRGQLQMFVQHSTPRDGERRNRAPRAR